MKSKLLLISVAATLMARDLVRIPPSSRQVKEGETGLPITISVGEFLISPTEVTQSEYESAIGSNPSFYKSPNHPVENVSWWDAIRYCNQRSSKEGLEATYDLNTGFCNRSKNGYRLPSDAEWDAASQGDDPKQANLGSSNTKSTAALMKLVQDKGTRPVASFAANRFGLHDMLGNVWEWTDDFFNPTPNTPQQNVYGLERIIRGGSFVSTVSSWSKGYRSSMLPESKSRFTGFRVCRTVRPAMQPKQDANWFQTFNKPPAGYESSTGNLTTLVGTNRETLRKKWQGILGSMNEDPPAPAARLIETIRDQHYTGKLMALQTEKDSTEKILLMLPNQPIASPTPVVIVPYYDVDMPAGRNLGGRSFMPGAARAYASLAVQRGFIAVAIRWFGESYGERYDEAVANLKLRHPQCTGLGKWVWDAQRLVDYLYTFPEVDKQRIGIMGHSLGAKMALYAAAMDERIGPTVFSEGGIGFAMSNYADYWYLGEAMNNLPPGTDQHELLALLAPRPFLLIGGDEYDGPQSWHYINAARKVYQLFEKPENIGYFNHHSGHTPTLEAVGHGMDWLRHFLNPAP